MPNATTIVVLDANGATQTISTIDNTIATAGSASAQVQSIQGIAGMTAVTVSGTVTANAGTNLNTSALALDTSVNGILLSQGSTTSGQKGPLVLGAVTTAAPTYTTAQSSPLSLDTSGNLRVSLQASGATVTVSGTVTANQGGAPWSANVTQFGGTNISTGTGASGAGIPRVTVANDSNILATQSGTWTVQQGGAPWSANITQIGGASLALGQTTMANSIPVTIASNQSALAVSQSGAPWSDNLTQVGGAAIALGQTTMASSFPVTIASNQAAIPVTLTTAGEPTLSISPISFATPQPVYLDDANTNYDDDGNVYVNTNVPGADISTGQNQLAQSTLLQSQISLLTSISLGTPVSQLGSWTVTANQGGAPWSMVGTLSNNNAAPAANNIGALIGLAGSANPSYTNGDQVLLSTDLSGNLRVTGSLSVGGTTDESTFTAGSSTGTPAMGAFQTSVAALTNNQIGIIAVDANRNTRVTGFLTQNNAAPAGTSLLGVMPAVASSAAPSYSAGNQVLLSTDLSGNLRVTGSLSVGGTTDETAFTAGTSTGTPSMGSYQNTIAPLANNQVGIIGLDQYRNTLVNIAASSIALPVYLDDRNMVYDDDGILYVNPNVPGADIATGQLQQSQLTVLQQIAAGTPVSGTVTANQGVANATPWNENVAQFGGNAVVTGTGASGSGIPRVTVSNDSNILATQSGSWTVTANAGTNLNTSALALDTSVNGILVSQGSTTSGEKGPLMQGAVTTNAPSYTTAQTDPLSLDTSGLLRVSIKDTPSNTNNFNVNLAASAATVTVSATNLSTNVAQFGGNNVVTGTGASGSGIPRVTVSNDSNILATQSGTWTVQQGGAPWSVSQSGAPWSVSQSGTWTVQQGSPPWTVSPITFATPQPVYLDDSNQNYDDDGNPYFNPNVPGADIATGANQLAQTTVLQQIAAGAPVSQQGTWTVQPGNTANTTPWLVTANQGGAPWSVVGTLTNNNAAPGANNVGVLPAIASSAAQSYTAGDQVLLNTDLSGNLKVTGSLSVGGTTDATAFTAGTSTGTAAMGSYQNTVSPLLNNQLGIVALDQYRNTKVNIAAISAGPIPVYLDDANTVFDDNGIPYVNTNFDGSDVATASQQALQTTALQTIATGAPVSQQGSWNVGATISNFPATQTVTLTPNAIAPIPVYLDDRNTVYDDNGIPFVNVNLDGQDIATPLQSIAAEGGQTGLAVPTAARYIAGNAQNVLPAANIIGGLTGLMTDKFGRQVILNSTIRDLTGTQTTTISASTSETTIVTAASNVFNDLIMLVVSNTSASTNTRIDFRDTTGGSVLFSLQSNGGQPPVGFTLATPVPQTGTNTNWTATCATSTTDIRIYAIFAKNR